MYINICIYVCVYMYTYTYEPLQCLAGGPCRAGSLLAPARWRRAAAQTAGRTHAVSRVHSAEFIKPFSRLQLDRPLVEVPPLQPLIFLQ